MAKGKNENPEFDELKRDIKSNTLKCLYAFHGEERYLLEHYLKQIRELVLPEGMEDFNHRIFTGQNFDVNAFSEAVDSLPMFAERTLIEVHDLDFSKLSEDTKEIIVTILSDIPEYACVLFIFDTVELKLNAKSPNDPAIKKCLTIVKFESQNQNSLVKWIKQHFNVRGKKIDDATAEYLAFVSGGLMTAIITEIEKCTAYAKDDVITRTVIDAVVTPVLDAALYKLTDEIMKGNMNAAAVILGDLIKLQEPPHKIIYGISQKMRQLLAAKICQENGLGVSDFKEICKINFDFQARNLFASAQKHSMDWCQNVSKLCAETAYKMNRSGQGNKELLVQLLTEISLAGRR